MGDIPEEAELTLRVGVTDIEKAKANPPRVSFNPTMGEYIGTITDNRVANMELLCYWIPKEAHSSMMCPRFAVTEFTEIVYVEIYVKVK